MKTSSTPFRLNTILSVIIGCATLSACEPDEPITNQPTSPSCEEEPLSDPSVICQESQMTLATQAECDAGVPCQSISVTLECGEEVTALCELTPDPDCQEDGIVPPQAVCEGQGLILATAEECENDPTCQTIINEGPCGFSNEVLCRETECDDIEIALPSDQLICEGEGLVLATEEECNSEVACQMIEFQGNCNQTLIALCKSEDLECLEEGRVDPSLICEGEGLVLATEEECVEGAMCQVIRTIGSCDIVYETLCKTPEDDCLAFPSCGPGTTASERTCRRGEESCELVTLCGETISCRPELSCNAYPSCGEGEVDSLFACEENGVECRAVTECDHTIFCRPDDPCRGIPSCGEGEIQSDEPCLATETTQECRAVSMCGDTIVCR